MPINDRDYPRQADLEPGAPVLIHNDRTSIEFLVEPSNGVAVEFRSPEASYRVPVGVPVRATGLVVLGLEGKGEGEARVGWRELP